MLTFYGSPSIATYDIERNCTQYLYYCYKHFNLFAHFRQFPSFISISERKEDPVDFVRKLLGTFREHMLWRSAHVAAMLGMSEVFVDADERHRMRLDLSYRISIKISLNFSMLKYFKSNAIRRYLFYFIVFIFIKISKYFHSSIFSLSIVQISALEYDLPI